MNSPAKIPAYKEPWFWAVFSPLIVVAIACAVLVTIAVRGADDRVYDDYYKQGRMINNQFDAEHVALALRVQGEIVFDFSNLSLEVLLQGRSDPDELQLQFSHPAESSMDQTITAKRDARGRYVATLDSELEGRWYLIVRALETETQAPWRVSSEIDFSKAQSISFQAHL